MPLLTVKPVVISRKIMRATPHSKQVYEWLKENPRSFHGVYSNPKKWFECNLFKSYDDATILQKIYKEYPNYISLCLEEYINFMFKHDYVYLLDSNIPFNFKSWEYVTAVYSSQATAEFMGNWVKQISIDERRKIVNELYETWKKRFGKKHLIVLIRAFGPEMNCDLDKLEQEYEREYNEERKIIEENQKIEEEKKIINRQRFAQMMRDFDEKEKEISNLTMTKPSYLSVFLRKSKN